MKRSKLCIAWGLTFRNRASYIGRAHRYPPNTLFYVFFQQYTYWIFFKFCTLSVFFSSKCCLFHNATFFVHVLFAFYIQGVLKFKCQILPPKGWSWDRGNTFMKNVSKSLPNCRVSYDSQGYGNLHFHKVKETAAIVICLNNSVLRSKLW
jgi:hypothetical protein